ncbi:MAG: hypothetical protein FWF85_01335 [Clostridiales bacterium]|jgi:hypothetical protein|nr:hypothetical protein [Clostridiales bacterium]
MIKVYLLQHYHTYGLDSEHDEIKAIGIFSSSLIAEEAITRYMELPGFKEYEKDCFYISEYDLDQELWTEGFIQG